MAFIGTQPFSCKVGSPFFSPSRRFVVAAFMIIRVSRRAALRRLLHPRLPSPAASARAPSPSARSTLRAQSQPHSNLRSPLPHLPAFLASSVSFTFSFLRDAIVCDIGPLFFIQKDHDFVPRTIGGTMYFPIRLDVARLGYVTPSGVEVFTDQ